tara:strand:+ start:1028 stop:1618 length:591 start_codon:yes stop_codon:yes gene_type:complete
MGVYPWFPTPVYIEGSNDETIQKELLEVYNKLEFSQIEEWSPHTHELNKNPFGRNILKEYECYNFLDFLDSHIKRYLQAIGFEGQYGPNQEQYVIDGAWFTKTKKGKYAHIHNHGSNDLSGVYYLQTNGKDGNLIFKSIHEYLQSNYIFGNIKKDVELPVEKGLIALWPGILNHGTQVNETDHERISLSFNIQFRR